MGIRQVIVVSDEEMGLLVDYEWPGNVRELQNMVERALILRKNDILSFRPLLNESKSITEMTANISLNDSMTLAITEALKKTNGRISGSNGAAAILGINPSTLRSRMKKLSIS